MYSFDVFDTLITRTTATPKGIFSIMQEELQSGYAEGMPNYITDNFYELRIHAEQFANLIKKSELTIRDIYDALSSTQCLTKEQVDILMQLEIETELAHTVGIPQNIDRVKRLVSEGQHVVLISDMYLGSDAIRKMLEKVDLVFETIRLYVSSDCKCNKYSGSLYPYVKAAENVDYSDWIHMGDNESADVKMPRTFGIRAEHFKFESLMPCEIHVLKTHEDNSFIQQAVGASRYARLKYGLQGSARIGASIGGGILYEYVLWILNQCMEKGIHRLYFIARDGYILQKIADIIIKKYNMPISTHYIYGSRRAWRMAAFTKDNCNIKKLMIWSHMHRITNVDMLANVFQISVSEMISFLPEEYKRRAGFSIYTIWEIAKILDNSDDFKRFLIEKNGENYRLVQEYIKQEIDNSDDDFAFVELSGGGFTQECFAEFFREIYQKPIRTFYFRLDRILDSERCVFHDFLPSNLYQGILIEPMCSAPHGQTTGYQRENDRIIPTMNEENSAYEKHHYQEYIDGILAYANEYSNIQNKLTLVLRYMDYAARMPDEELLDFIAGIPNSETGRENSAMVFAPKLTRKEIRNIFLLNGGNAWQYYKGSSLEYSLLRCNDKERRYIEFCKRNSDRLLGKMMRYLLQADSTWSVRMKTGFPPRLLVGDVVIYGAGKFGTQVYREAKRSCRCSIVAWVDKDYMKYGRHVSPVENIRGLEFDKVIIAVINKLIAENIRENLISLGVCEDKIVWVDWEMHWEDKEWQS